MALISIDDTIQFIEATEDPLSADIGIVPTCPTIMLSRRLIMLVSVFCMIIGTATAATCM